MADRPESTQTKAELAASRRAAARAAREAAALRANLSRRKAQSRARQVKPSGDAPKCR